jgi:hypothetical protein
MLQYISHLNLLMASNIQAYSCLCYIIAVAQLGTLSILCIALTLGPRLWGECWMTLHQELHVLA